MSDTPRVRRIDAAFAWFTFERTATTLLFVVVAAAALLMPAQSDTWWHLRAGEEIWLHRAVPVRDSFSHTVQGGYWPDHEWLTQALFYGMYRAGGLRLLTAVVAVLATAAWAIVWRLTPGNHLRRLMLLSVGIVPSTIVWSIRPQVLTLFCVALTAFLVSRRRYLWLPVVFLLWANLHGAVLLGLVILLAATLGAAIDDRPAARRLVTVVVSCMVATTMTPLGFLFWTEMPASLARIRQYGISEWRAPAVLEPNLLPFWIAAIALVALVALQRPWRSRLCLTNPLICGSLALIPLAVTSERNIPPFMMLAVPALGCLIDASVPIRAPARSRRERPVLNLAIVLSAAVASLSLVAYAWTVEWPRLGWHPIPDEAIASVSSCPEHLYNRYDEGGYLIWFARKQKVFLDGRQDPYPPELVLEQVRVETSGDYEATFRQHGIGCAFIPSDSLLARRLIDAGWRATYRTAVWSVLARPPL